MQTTRLLLERGNKNWCFEILKDYVIYLIVALLFVLGSCICALGDKQLKDNWRHKKTNELLEHEWEVHLHQKATWLKGEERQGIKEIE